MCLSPNETEYVKDDHYLPMLQKMSEIKEQIFINVRDIAGLKFKVHTCGNLLNAIMHIIPKGNIACNKQRRPR